MKCRPGRRHNSSPCRLYSRHAESSSRRGLRGACSLKSRRLSSGRKVMHEAIIFVRQRPRTMSKIHRALFLCRPGLDPSLNLHLVWQPADSEKCCAPCPRMVPTHYQLWRRSAAAAADSSSPGLGFLAPAQPIRMADTKRALESLVSPISRPR